MNFLAAAQHMADMTSDSLDPTMQDAALPTSRTWGQPTPQTDDLDPAAPGGPSPYNGAPPFGEPVTSDQMWLDPQKPAPHTRTPMPHTLGPDEDVTTLHSARLASYEAKADRYSRRTQ